MKNPIFIISCTVMSELIQYCSKWPHSKYFDLFCGLHTRSHDDGRQTHSLVCTLKAFMRSALGPVIGRRAPITFSFVGVTTPLHENSQQAGSLKWRSDGVTFQYLFYSYYSQMFHSLVLRPWSEGKRSWGTEYSFSVLSDRRPNSVRLLRNDKGLSRKPRSFFSVF